MSAKYKYLFKRLITVFCCFCDLAIQGGKRYEQALIPICHLLSTSCSPYSRIGAREPGDLGHHPYTPIKLEKETY